ncbi:MAG: hypothetical protein WDN69_11645, partial [Aliidongia sp.]
MPLRHDYLGNPVTGAGDATLAAIDDFVGGFLGYETRALGILAAAEADPECCVANLYAGALVMLTETPNDAAHAARYLHRAEQAARHATTHERGQVRFLELWSRNEIPAALVLAEELAAANPRDLVLVKLHHYLAFNLGNAPSMLRIALAVAPHTADVAQSHGMLAFAYEECHLIAEAEAAAETALRLTRKEPWAQHALAHISLSRGAIDTGSAFLEDMQDSWTGLNSFMLTHLWWHQCLFYLSQGRFDRVLAIYDEIGCGIDKSYSQDQIGAVSLLARIELAGVEIGQRWQALGQHLAARAEDTVQPFLSLQYLYGLARAGRPEAETLLAAIRRRAETAADFVRPTWRDVALPMAEALVAHAEGRYPAALAGLDTALPRLAEIGGSHAQRDLFLQIRLDALRRAGHWNAAQQELETRRRHDPVGVPLNRTLAEIYGKLGLPAQSAEAASRARATSEAHAA